MFPEQIESASLKKRRIEDVQVEKVFSVKDIVNKPPSVIVTEKSIRKEKVPVVEEPCIYTPEPDKKQSNRIVYAMLQIIVLCGSFTLATIALFSNIPAWLSCISACTVAILLYIALYFAEKAKRGWLVTLVSLVLTICFGFGVSTITQRIIMQIVGYCSFTEATIITIALVFVCSVIFFLKGSNKNA